MYNTFYHYCQTLLRVTPFAERTRHKPDDRWRLATLVSVGIRMRVKDMVEVVRVTLVGTNTESRLVTTLESLIEATQDFTDSAYTTHDHRQQILMICEQLRHQLGVVMRIGASLVRTTTDLVISLLAL